MIAGPMPVGLKLNPQGLNFKPCGSLLEAHSRSLCCCALNTIFLELSSFWGWGLFASLRQPGWDTGTKQLGCYGLIHC